jgi:2-polyprenyl-3-methyl-5-hydroxy-6-metoxy-1,4-benzoquinol methylase
VTRVQKNQEPNQASFVERGAAPLSLAQTREFGMATALVSEFPDVASSTDEYATRFEGPAGKHLLDVQNRAVMRLASPWFGGSILDVGGGHAQLCGPLLDAGCGVTVLGSQDSCLDRPRRIAAERVSCVVGDLLDPPFSDCAFDVVIAIRMLAHITDTERFIRGLCRVARHAVIVDYPEIRSINALTPTLYGLKKKLEGNTRTYRMYHRRDLERMFVSHGFGAPRAIAQFFWPMVLHRKLSSPFLSRALEAPVRLLQISRWFGSPVILRLERI